MKLIFVHGRAQENYEAENLKKEWTYALTKGLEKSGLTLPQDLKIEFPYYGKLLKKLVDEAEKPLVLSTAATRSLDDVSVDDFEKDAFYTAFLAEIIDNVAMSPEEKQEIKALKQDAQTRGLENNAIVQKLLSFLDRKGIFGETLIKNFTKDVFMYLTIKNIKKQVNDTVLKSFDDTPCVVVAHSLGSIVSYLILKNNPQFKVKKFITVGSPLGLMSIRPHIETPILMPACVQNGWFNAYDDRDVVALNPLDKQYFNVQPTIENKRDVDNHTDNRHGVDGYLMDAVVAQHIYNALITK